MKMKEVIITLTLGFLLTLAVFLYLFTPTNNWKVVGTSHQYNFEEIKKKMSYHGTLIVYVDEDGQWWFFNKEGVKCKLR